MDNRPSGDNANALQTFIVTLGMPGEWERLEYESDTRPNVGEAILLSDDAASWTPEQIKAYVDGARTAYKAQG